MTTDSFRPSTSASGLAVLPERLPFFSTEFSAASGSGSGATAAMSSSPAAREQRRRLHLYNIDAESHLAFKVRALKRGRKKEGALIAFAKERGERLIRDHNKTS